MTMLDLREADRQAAVRRRANDRADDAGSRLGRWAVGGRGGSKA